MNETPNQKRQRAFPVARDQDSLVRAARGSGPGRTTPSSSCVWRKRGATQHTQLSNPVVSQRARLQSSTAPDTLISLETNERGRMQRGMKRRKPKRKRRKRSMKISTLCDFPTQLVKMASASPGIHSAKESLQTLLPKTSGAITTLIARLAILSGSIPMTHWL